jgi:hypothetical protein
LDRDARLSEAARRWPLNAHQVALAVMFAVAWWCWDAWFFWPLKMAVVAVHEGSHALMTWLTGGAVESFGLGLDQSGHVLSRGGNAILILNAGYLGSLLFGVGLLLLTRKGGWTVGRLLLRGFGLYSVMYALLDIRDDVLLGAGASDAVALARLTGVPALVWGLAWIVAGVAVLWKLRRPLSGGQV